jgi:hypothetical protein
LADRFAHGGEEIVADVATNTTIGEIDDVPAVFNADNEFGVNVDRAEVVHQYGDPKAVTAGEDAIQ